MKHTPAVKRLLDRLNLHGKYITYVIADLLPDDEVVTVSTEEAASTITAHNRKLADLQNPKALARRYSELRGWNVVDFSIGIGSQGGPE
jgi:hypothetical protein